MINLQNLESELPRLQRDYRNARPFPHLIFDGFCEQAELRNVAKAFPKVTDDQWTHYLHYNEKKHGLSKTEMFPPVIRDLINQLNGPAFVSFLSRLTGIEGLISDPDLEGGGLHQSQRGGFLRIHSDFLSHPRHASWRRRINVLVYLNEQWEDSYGGHLELWSDDMSTCMQRISPLFNRCVLFNTHDTSFHGHPEPLSCPDSVTRKSIALYYYTKDHSGSARATTYMARPTDRSRKILIAIDNRALRIYHWMKLKFGVRDGLISRILKRFAKRNK